MGSHDGRSSEVNFGVFIFNRIFVVALEGCSTAIGNDDLRPCSDFADGLVDFKNAKAVLWIEGEGVFGRSFPSFCSADAVTKAIFHVDAYSSAGVVSIGIDENVFRGGSFVDNQCRRTAVEALGLGVKIIYLQ